MIKNFSKIFALILTLIFSANYYAQCTGCTVVQNVACSDNGTPGTSTDDSVSFEVSTSFFSDYSITATFAGSSVPITLMDGTSATNLMGGVVQHFKIMNGALGTGNFTLTITPVTGTPETLTFANPGTCSTVCTSASTGNTVSYVYDSQYIRGDIQGEAFSLPKFDEGTNRKLTKVTVEYGSRVYGSALIENTGSATAPGKYRIQSKHYGDIAFLGFTNSNAGDIILQSPGYPALATIPAAVNVPAQGSWPGDVTYAIGTVTAMSTMSRMQISPDNTWLDNYLLRGVNPNTSPNWVTNITGNASHDDDFVFLPVQSNAYIQPALTYTLQADLNKFIGTGAFNGTYDATTSMSSTGSINLAVALINNLYAKVTYTYDCIAPPAIDAIDGSQTVSSGTTGTSVLANDTIENGAAGSVTLGATGNATISQTNTTNAGVNIDTATGNVVVSPGTPAGTYTITYEICTKATPVTCDTAQETVTVPNLLDAVNDNYGPVTPGTSTTSVIANDKNNSGTAAVIGSGAGQVSITTSTDAAGTAGAWPAGFTLKPDGTISVANGTAAGTYTLYYTICNQTAGSPCDTATVTITVVANSDSDGDGVPDYQDLDSDNDGILDIFECPQSVVDVNFSVANGNSQTFSVPAADLGFIFDVYTLDNSFTLTVNGASISSSKLEFQPDQTDNVRFMDGSRYENGGIPQIWGMTGTAANPLVRLIIHKNGAISMYGSKTSGGPLFPLQLYNGNNFNTIIWNQTSANTVVVSQVVVGPTNISGRGIGVRNGFCDPDNDGISNQFDVDSDNDGCADAIEGSENVKYNQIHDLNLPLADPNYAYRGQIKVTYNGTTTSTPSGIISNSPSANGVPQLLNNAGNNLNTSTNPSNLAGTVDNTDGTADIGQGIGEAYNAAIQSGCFCYKPAQTTGTILDTNHGITALGRAGADNSNWPMVRKGAWTALEAKTKGFVVNRLTDAQVSAIPSADLREGMMVYNITQDCLQINIDGTATGWRCFNTQTCPD